MKIRPRWYIICCRCWRRQPLRQASNRHEFNVAYDVADSTRSFRTCGGPKGRVGDYAESHSGLPPQTLFDAPGEGGGAHSSLPPQPVFGAFAKSIPRTWVRFSPQIMRGIMRAVGYAEPQYGPPVLSWAREGR